MRTTWGKAVLCGLTLTALVGCAAQTQMVASTTQACKAFMPGELYVQKTDNFLVILDSSETMGGMHNKQQKLSIAKATVDCMNQCIPDIKLTAGLRTYGRGYYLFSIFQTNLRYGMKPYARAELSDALAKVDLPIGNSPMAKALTKACGDIEKLSGTTAIILLSDGKPTDEGQLQAAKTLKEKYGDNICIYTILIGDDVDGKKLMEQIAKAGGCGFSVNADELATCEAMAGFVQKVFFKKKCVDSDADGVCDDKDKCPGTPKGAKVNEQGCWVISDVLFDFDKADINPEAVSILDECVTVLKNNPKVKIQIQGHTDSRGTETYNMNLSRRRAQAVKQYFVKHGIKANMLSTAGYGLSRPVAPNTTDEGRAKNRRVELHTK